MAVVVLLATLAVAGCGGGGIPSTPPPAAGPALVPANSGDLVAYATQRLRARFGAGVPAGLAATAGGSPASGDAIAAASRPGTLVQEAGVDEADLLKIDRACASKSSVSPVEGLRGRHAGHDLGR